MTEPETDNKPLGECSRCGLPPAWSPFRDPALTLAHRIGIVRRMLKDARRMRHSGMWLSVEEVEAVLSQLPPEAEIAGVCKKEGERHEQTDERA